MRILHYPDYSRDNPYQSLMFRELREQGCEVEAFGGRTRPVLERALKDDAQILHLHWISNQVVSASLVRSLGIMLGFYAALVAWRARGGKIVWTVHNLGNHERRRLWLDRLHARIIARLAHRVLVHGESARGLAARALAIPERRISVVHHGNYAGAFEPAPVDRAHEGRRFLFFGQIRAYKGVPDLIRAFRALEGPHALRIAGRVDGDGLAQEIEAASAGDPRIRLDLSFVSDDELAEALAWSDVVALPYRDIFTSGSLLMALTAGRPVVAPDRGLIPEYMGEGAGYLYDPGAADGLSRALRQAADDPALAEKAEAALRRADRFGWNAVGAELLAVYEALCPGTPRRHASPQAAASEDSLP